MLRSPRLRKLAEGDCCFGQFKNDFMETMLVGYGADYVVVPSAPDKGLDASPGRDLMALQTEACTPEACSTVSCYRSAHSASQWYC